MNDDRKPSVVGAPSNQEDTARALRETSDELADAPNEPHGTGGEPHDAPNEPHRADAPNEPHDAPNEPHGTGGEPHGTGGELDLTPVPIPPRRSRKRRLYISLLGLLIAGGAAFALFQLISGASLFFLNVDEAVNRRPELGERRFRMQGTPVADSVAETRMDFNEAVAFTVAFEGMKADVVHVGAPPDLFAPGVPVVLEGRWRQGAPPDLERFNCGVNDGFYFASDRLLIKHDNEYRNEYPERLLPAETGGC